MHYDVKQSGKYIRSLRVQKGYTQERLAEILNVDRSFLSHIESGKKGCSVDLLVQLANILGVSLDELVSGQRHYDLSIQEDIEKLKREIRNVIVCLMDLEAGL